MTGPEAAVQRPAVGETSRVSLVEAPSHARWCGDDVVMSAEPRWDVPQTARGFQGHRAGVVSRTVVAALDVAVVLLAPYAGLAATRYVVDPVGCPLPGASLLLSLTSALVALVQKDQANLEVRHE